MEEDIKLVESLLKEFEVYGDLDVFEDIRPYMEAIEHLIKAYKELKEEKGWLLEEVNYLNEEKWQDFEFFVNILSKTIPTSKIKEIRDKAEVMDYYTLSDVIEDLNKLLGDD